MEELKYFFSYVSTDSEFVLQLAKKLRAVGANLWLDQLDILGGQHWDSTVEKALRSCKGMIVVLSPESVASDNVMDEVSYALDEGKLVVPVLIRSCNIPFRLRRVQYVDFTADYDTGFSRLLRALRIEQPVQPQESASAREPVVQEPSLPKQSEPAPDALDQSKPTGVETEKAWSKRQTAKVLAAICLVTLIAITSTIVFLKYFQPKTCSLSITANGGSVTKEPNQISYKHGETVTLKAIPNNGHSFDYWSDDLSGSTNPATLVMDADKSVTANFVPKTYSLTATAVNGSVTKSPDKASYKHGEKVTLEAEPNPGYNFTGWSGDKASSTKTTTLVMDADKTVTANFALPKAGDVVTNSIGMKLVYIPAGSFKMGSGDSATDLVNDYKYIGAQVNESYFKDEFLPHEVSISEGFWIGQTEVTQGQYREVMKEEPWSGKDNVKKDPNYPAVYVSWDDAVEFCRKLSNSEMEEGKRYRLPTEAEWEYSCRAGTRTRFSFGDSDSLLGEYAWYRSNTEDAGQKYAHPVGAKNPNLWGLYDMHGNVWEWCSDWYDATYYSDSPRADPNGPQSGTLRSLRGGSWRNDKDAMRCSERFWCSPNEGGENDVGFRVVRSKP